VKPEANWVTGIVQHTDFQMIGEFTTSSPQLNQLQSNIEWGLKGNFLDIPTDCPQRSERLGWTGDALAFAPTSLFVADSHAFWSAWLKSVREEQFDNHGIPVVVPNEVGEIVQAGWSDAAVTIPWDVYWSTGNTRILADNYQMMTRWIQYHQSELDNGISKMWTVGDWLQPYSTRQDSRRGETDHSLISTAFYAHSLDIVARTARVLGKRDDAEYYEQLFKETKKTFQTHFFDSQGKLKVGEQTQTSYLLAIGFDLLDQELAKKAEHHLLAQFQKTGGHLRTGFLGTPLLAPVLEKIGRLDIALELLFKETYPSWLYSVSQGATTMWERWDGFSRDKGYADKAGSLNHYAYGAIGQWLYERLAGISPLNAGYKKVRIAPIVTEHLSFAEASFQSPHGKIGSRWSLNTDSLVLEIDIPPNVEALLEVPAVVFSKSSLLNKRDITPLLGAVSINGKAIAEFGDNLVTKASENANVSNYVKLTTGHYIVKVARKNSI
jgi:alpha-L-rhamnosidase